MDTTENTQSPEESSVDATKISKKVKGKKKAPTASKTDKKPKVMGGAMRSTAIIRRRLTVQISKLKERLRKSELDLDSLVAPSTDPSSV